MSISTSTIKKLYAKSAGICNKCRKSIVESEVQIGEMAHIIAQNLSGPRGNSLMQEDVNGYKNLILLCPTCHTEIDKNYNNYSVEYLLKLKNNHEQNIASSVNQNKFYIQDSQSLQLLMDYMPFSKMRIFCESLPSSINIDYTIPIDTFENFKIGNPHSYPFNDEKLTIKFSKFVDDLDILHNIILGYTAVSDNTYEFIPFNVYFNSIVDNQNIVNTQKRVFQNYTQADINENVYINKIDINHDILEKLILLVEEKRNMFLTSYYDLLNYLRDNYRDVNLNSYRPYVF